MIASQRVKNFEIGSQAQTASAEGIKNATLKLSRTAAPDIGFGAVVLYPSYL